MTILSKNTLQSRNSDSSSLAPPSSNNNKSSQDETSTTTEARDPTYFQYYAQFVHQQNMLQDNVRTSMYYSAILANKDQTFFGKTVMDVGAGSGILSYFAIMAGADHVYAVEASNMANRMNKLLKACPEKNPTFHNKMTVLPGKIEDLKPMPRVDTLVSEPIGVFLVHERMIESYLFARDHFLKPGGAMIPSSGNIYCAPFTDGNLWTQTMSKVRFWEQTQFYGVDLSPLASDARDEIFGQPVVGGFDVKQLLSPSTSYAVDFETITVEGLKEFVIPFSWTVQYTGICHGLASWFDINLGGYTLSTAPQFERTHWHQVRLLLKEPLAVNAGQTIKGWLHFVVNNLRSYNLTLELVLGSDAELPEPPLSSKTAGKTSTTMDPSSIRRSGKYNLHEQSYNFDSYPLPEHTQPEVLGLYAPVVSSEQQQEQPSHPPSETVIDTHMNF